MYTPCSSYMYVVGSTFINVGSWLSQSTRIQMSFLAINYHVLYFLLFVKIKEEQMIYIPVISILNDNNHCKL